MTRPAHQHNSRSFVPEGIATGAHLTSSTVYTSVIMFSLFFTLSIIAVMLLLWFIYLRRREEELETTRRGMGGPGLALPPIAVRPSAIANIVQQPFIKFPQCGFSDCQQPVLPIPVNANTLGFGTQPLQPPSMLPNLPMPPMTVTPTTLMSMTSTPSSNMTPMLFQQTITTHTSPSPMHSKIEGVGSSVPMIPFGVGMPSPPQPLPYQTSHISNAGVPEPIYSTQDIHNRSLSSQGISDPIFQLQQLQNSADLRRAAEHNAMLAAMSPGGAYLLADMPYYSEGPDIPMAASVVLGPSPTAGQRVHNNITPPSLPPQITEAGIRNSRTNQPMGIMELMPQGNILGLDKISHPPPGHQFLKKTTITTETVQPPTTVTYPMLPPMPQIRPMSPAPGLMMPMAPFPMVGPPAMRPLTPGLPPLRM